MSDTIYRRDAIDAVEKESQVDGAYGYMDTKSIIDLLCDLPSAQPEIIRCGECKYMMEDGRCYEFADDNIRPSASDFCSYAERKANE